MTWRRSARTISIGAVLQVAAGCASIHTPFTHPESSSAWPDVLATARTRAANGRFDGADSTLADFATKYPGSPEAAETAYWRAMFRMDPTNPRASLPTALASLDAYLTDSRPREHVVEATSLRRIAGQLEGLSKLAANAMTQPKDPSAAGKGQVADASKPADTAASADAEIKRLKDELAKANAELDRIRKRLSQPPPRQQ